MNVRLPSAALPCVTMVAAAVAALLAVAVSRAANPNALWNIVSGACVPHQRDGEGPRPCVLVDLDRGYAVLKDLVGETQFLMIPTVRIGGMESPELLAPDAPSYWADAWAARSFVVARAGRALAPDEIGLAINSVSGRSQNQLHIHVDCIRPDVRATLRDRLAGIGESWAPLPVAFAGHTYLARRIGQPTLDGVDPFRLLAEGVPTARADMAHETMVLTGAALPDGRSGFILLADHADAATGDVGSGEELLDHACALAHAS
jgi:CDP-diacylglycerol pyrophosphatase